ncbi:MAG TPA: hypothetical protein EYO01_00740 [Phycisphaerales bacterium]|nr:hypothetical protein [Phycisphaerales bacterium]HIB51086.1 hypothetical protein [Phycisphaerales bacterium]HIN83419.1 hypothetical protein [Phycisphaerales bacterium]HIO52588.1 hypothetical protein [Phycisphaerales bacterium]
MRKLSIFIYLSLCMLAVSAFATTPQDDVWSDSVIETEEDGVAVLIIPMHGQMHTDIQHELYQSMVDRIKEADPDLIIVELLSRDYKNEFHTLMGWGERLNFNSYDAEDMVKIAEVFHIPLADFPQVVWVEDSAGSSTVLALSWSILYMSDDAYLHSTYLSSDFNNINAEDTRGKIREFRMIHTKTLAEFAGRDHALLRAFADPDVPLSGSWEGKDVVWADNLEGDLILDQGVDYMPHLSATIAAEVGISKGNANSRNDVLLSEGIRVYHLVGEDITDELTAHSVTWRKDFLRAEKMLRDGEQYGGWATGNDTAKYLRKQLAEYKKLVKLLKKSSAAATRIGRKHRISVKALEKWIEDIEEELEQLKNGGRGRGGGGGGPIGGGGG